MVGGVSRFTGKDALQALVDNPKIVEHLQGAVKRSNGRQTFETLIEEIVRGATALWIKENSVIVTQRIAYPTGAHWLSVRIGAGDAGTLQEMLPELEEHARENGLSGVESISRKGWARIGKALGYAETHSFLEKRF